jgi:hypothetical protein
MIHRWVGCKDKFSDYPANKADDVIKIVNKKENGNLCHHVDLKELD